MKTRLGTLIVLVTLLWGCGAAPTEVRPAEPSPVVTPAHLAPTPTPNCRNFKLCQGL